MRLVIVKRGQLSTFRALSDQLVGDEVRLIWDRRSGLDRRKAAAPVPSEERRQERRRPPDILWSTMGYSVATVVGQPS
jgi:hypothetical protein